MSWIGLSEKDNGIIVANKILLCFRLQRFWLGLNLSTKQSRTLTFRKFVMITNWVSGLVSPRIVRYRDIPRHILNFGWAGPHRVSCIKTTNVFGGCYYGKTMDYIFNGMRFKINENQIMWLVKSQILDVWTLPKDYTNLEEEIVHRMISLHYLYKDFLIKL